MSSKSDAVPPHGSAWETPATLAGRQIQQRRGGGLAPLRAACRPIGVWKCPSAHEPDHPGLPGFKEGDKRRKTLTINRREGKLTKHPEEKL